MHGGQKADKAEVGVVTLRQFETRLTQEVNEHIRRVESRSAVGQPELNAEHSGGGAWARQLASKKPRRGDREGHRFRSAMAADDDGDPKLTATQLRFCHRSTAERVTGETHVPPICHHSESGGGLKKTGLPACSQKS